MNVTKILAFVVFATTFACNAQTEKRATYIQQNAPMVAPGVVSLIAGNLDGLGAADGVGLRAQFGYAESADIGTTPKGITSDKAGNLYIVDTPNHTIRKMTPKGVVTTIAGKAGFEGHADGMGSEARFKFPTGIAIDKAENLYITDSANFTIRKMTPDGYVSTIAGSPEVTGRIDGQGSAARFRRPTGIVVNSAGELFVADSFNLCIRKISPTGFVTTFAGKMGESGFADGVGTVARFKIIRGIAIDRNDALYVADKENNAIRHVTRHGIVSTLNLIPPKVNNVSNEVDDQYVPETISIDKIGNLYMSAGRVIQKIDREGRVSDFAGQNHWGGRYEDGLGTLATFSNVGNGTFDANGNMYVTDDMFVRKISPKGKVTTIAGQRPQIGTTDGVGAAARFNWPVALAVDKEGNILVSDRGNGLIRKIDSFGRVTTVAGVKNSGQVRFEDGPALSARFNGIGAFAIDAKNNIFITDTGNEVIRKLSSDGNVTTIAGIVGKDGDKNGPAGVALFDHPFSFVVDSKGNLFVEQHERIKKIDKDGIVSTFVGNQDNPWPPAIADGVGVRAHFVSSRALTIDKNDTIYVSDDAFIRKVSPQGVVETVANVGEKYNNFDDWSYTYFPSSLVVDDLGNIYFAFSNSIRKLAPNGSQTTVAGVTTLRGGQLGTPGILNRPTGLAMLDSKTLVFISGNAILKLSLP